MPSFTSQEITECVDGVLEGPGDLVVSGVEQLRLASARDLTFIRERHLVDQWQRSAARVALVPSEADLPRGDGRAFIRVDDPDIAIAVMLEHFAPPETKPSAGVHARAIVDPSASIDLTATVDAGCFVGAGVKIGPRCVLRANVTIMDHCTIGADGRLYPGVVVRERCTLGDGVILHPNVVIGADGFGYRPSPDGETLIKIPQIGTVEIGNNVEIGASSCVDRGKFSATIIRDGTKIDNLCQIGHNCIIGRNVVMAGGCSIGGSVNIGDNAMLGGASAVRDHVNIGANAKLAGFSGLVNDLPDGESYFGCPAHDVQDALKETIALRKLPSLLKTVRQLKSKSDKD